MKLLIVGLGSMGKRRARLARGMDASIQISGVDTTESRRAEAEGLGITAYASIGEAVAADKFDAALVCTAPSPMRPLSASCWTPACRCSPS